MDIVEMLRMCGDSISNQAANEIESLREQVKGHGVCTAAASQPEAEQRGEPANSSGGVGVSGTIPADCVAVEGVEAMETDEPTIAKPPTEQEVAELCEIAGPVARRLAFQRDRLISAIDGKNGWKDEVARLNKRIEELELSLDAWEQW